LTDESSIKGFFNTICYFIKQGLTMHTLNDPPHNYTYFVRKIEMLLSELLTKNQSILGKLNKVEVEIVKKISDLQTAIDTLTAQMGDVELTAEQTASIDALQTAVDALDNIVPDNLPEPTPEPTPEV
jgi:hypothetical protein